MLKQDSPKNDIPKDIMINAKIRFLEGRNKFLSHEIMKNNAEITKLEEFRKS